MTLTIELTDERVEAVIRALDQHTSDRQQQVYTLRSALQWIETVAFPNRFADPRIRDGCKAHLHLCETPAPVLEPSHR